MTARRQTTIRLPDDLADQAEAVARVRGVSLNTLFVEAITAEVDRARASKAFNERARELRRREKELLKRAAR
jgi:predicted transcriptional regulator